MVASDMRRLLALAAAVVLLATGCRSQPVTTGVEAVPIEDENRFPHATHAQISCTECHALASVLAGEKALPGADDHAPCDRSGCHQPAFLSAPGPLCEVCHQSLQPANPGMSPLRDYPRTRGYRALASRFAHDRHLDLDRMEKSVGFHVACKDCHALDNDDAPTLPGHDVCARCHAPEAAAAGMPAMNDCARCHRARERQPAHVRRFIVGDLRFRHGPHRADRRGTRIRCADCHTETRTVRALLDHPLMDTGVCVDCHDDSDRTPSSKRMRECDTCHTDPSRRLRVLAPRSHLPRLDRPEDHTLAFRRSHSQDAQSNPQRCARCHTFMSGAPRDVCDECHQVMRPRDHLLTWREFDHGPEASARADRCTVCHKGTFCSSCHSRTPRSHLPLSDFRDGGHAMAARLNLRACITCHEPDGARGCRRPGCHDGGVTP